MQICEEYVSLVSLEGSSGFLAVYFSYLASEAYQRVVEQQFWPPEL